MIDQQKGTEAGAPRMTWALRSLCQPSRRAHLLTTDKRVVVPPAAAVRSPGAAPPGCPPLPVYTSRRQRRLVHWAELHRCTGGLGAIGHQQAAPGIYRRIACHYYQCL